MSKKLTSFPRKSALKDSTASRPSLNDIQSELAMKFGTIGVLLDEMYQPGAGAKLFGCAENESMSGISERINVSATTIGRQLPFFYEYAYNGQLLSGHENTVDPFGSNAAELLRDFVEIFGNATGYTELSDAVACEGMSDFKLGGLTDLVDRMIARHNLDKEYPLSVPQLALLSGMNERSVRNMTSSVKNQLPLNASGEVDFHFAMQWLSERSGRGFSPTVKKGFPAEQKESDVDLDATSIPAFIKHRLVSRFAKNGSDEALFDQLVEPTLTVSWDEAPRGISEAAAEAKLSANDLIASMRYPLAIPPHHCAGLAKAIGADPAWFTLQVMRALHPQEMDMVLNPTHYQHAALRSNTQDEPLKAIEVVLTSSMIVHGYLDMPVFAKTMFPDDCFDTSSIDGRGSSVTFYYGGNQTAETDIRIKSEKTISPRKRFTAWLQTELSATPGDRVRIERTSTREYTLSFQPVVQVATEGAQS